MAEVRKEWKNEAMEGTEATSKAGLGARRK